MREIKRSGKRHEFYRICRNEFGEATDCQQLVGSLCGIYHEINNHVFIETKDTTQTRNARIGFAKQPAILCLMSDVNDIGLKDGDLILLNCKRFSITGVVNIQEWNIIADISLEAVDDGVNVSL